MFTERFAMNNEISSPGASGTTERKHFNIYNKNDLSQEPTFVTTGRQIESIAREKMHQTAIIEISQDDSEIKTASWTDLYRKSNQLSWLLKDEGLTKKSTVVVCLPNTITHVLCAYATWKIGACYMPVAPRSTEGEILNFIELSKPDLVITDGFRPEECKCFGSEEILHRLTEYSDKMPPDILAIPFRAQTTGGSTGKPKLIKYNQASGESDESLMAWFHMTGQFFGCRQLICGPMFHAAPCSAVFSGLNSGNLVVMPNNFKPAALVKYIKEYKIECMQIVPTLMQRILKLDNFNPEDFSSLKALCHTGGYCSKELKRAWIDLLGAKNVYEMYSMSEMIGITVIRGDEWLKHEGSIGRPFGGSKVSVRDENGNELPPYEIGEIFMTPAGGCLETEYVGRSQLKDYGNGFRSVGDMGYLDEDGYLYFSDRRSDMIVTGGENVFAVEVENVFMQNEDIVDIAVVGIPDPEWGRRIHAVVEAKREMSYDEFRRYGWKFLLPFKVPKTVEFVDSLPRKDSGKLNRKKLAEDCEILQKDLVKPFGIINTGLRHLLKEAAQNHTTENPEK